MCRVAISIWIEFTLQAVQFNVIIYGREAWFVIIQPLPHNTIQSREEPRVTVLHHAGAYPARVTMAHAEHRVCRLMRHVMRC
jgi:hypothetical protein